MKPTQALLFGFLLLLLAGRARAAEPPTLVLRDTAATYLLENPYLQILRVDSALTLAQIGASPWAARFRTAPTGIPNYGGDGADFWLRARVRSRARATTVWVLDTHFGDHDFEVFVTDSLGRPLARTVVDDARRFRNGQAVPGRHPSVRLVLPAGQSAWVYVHATGYVFQLRLRELTHQLQVTRVSDLREAVYFGILLALMLYNLGLFISVRDRAYLYYVGFVASFGALQASMMHYLAVFVWPTASPAFDTWVNHALLVAVMVMGIHTARAFMELATYTPRLDRLLRALAWATLLLPLFDLLGFMGLPGGYWLSQWAEVVLPLTGSAVTLLAGALTVRAGYGPARYYLAGWAILLAATTSYYLRVLHVLPPSFFTEYGTRIASVIDLLLISLGLADRINIARQERREALDQALAVAQEKEAVQAAANRALALRADELQLAYADLQASLRTTESLTERDELKTRFFTNISHELRTPLTLILGPLEQLLDTPAAGPVAPELHLMHRHGARLLALINQLLDVARLEAGQLALHAAPHDLHGFVRLQVAAFQSHAADLGLTLALPPLVSPLEVYFDADLLEKVLTNLLGNALKFTPGGGRVEVLVRAEDGAAPAAVITVADTGCGIPATHLPLIFDRFHQVDDSARRAHEGSGIGLALVKELVSLHGGTVAVESVAGQGTTFSVRLLLGTAHLEPEQLRPSAAPA
ncbi:MAG: sensor histidine kinase, partial [Bacteroidota bacterium]|nr:sensor histidine kinase [Bacteroidota bacterium]